MPLQEPVEFFGVIQSITKKMTKSNDVDVILKIEVSDYLNVKTEVMRKLADIVADEYFTIRISEGT